MKKLKRNAMKCLTCGAVVESKFRHDFQPCLCPEGSGTEIFVDGGLDYQRCGFGRKAIYVDKSEYES